MLQLTVRVTKQYRLPSSVTLQMLLLGSIIKR